METRVRVTFVAPAVPGREEPNGFSSRLYEMLLALLRVADVDLFLPRSSEADAPHAIAYLRKLDGLTLHLVLDTRTRSPIAHRVARVGHHLFGELPRWSTPRRAPELKRHLESGRADVLCLHLPVTAHLAAFAPAGVPVIAMLEEGLERGILAPKERTRIHTIAARREMGRVHRLYRLTAERAALVVAISAEEGEALAAAGIALERIVVVPRGIDLSYFEPDGGRVEPDFDVAVFGDFRFARNLDPARDAVSWASSHQPTLRWAFVGEVDLGDAETLRAAGVEVTGRVDDLRAYYAKTKIVLVPAVAVTGVKTTLVQAWAMEKAVVSTPESALGLPVVDGVNVVIGGSTPELVDSCAALAASPPKREELGAAGRRTVCEQLDGGRIAADFAKLVRSVAVSSQER
jgi:glycosyltransferase involved in cell wall biosynthesis